MKRIIAVVVVLLLMFSLSLSVCAEGVNVQTDNGDMVTLFQDVNIDKVVNGNIIAVFGNVEINADINGQVITVFGNVKINSRVAGQVITVMGDTKLGENSVISGNLISLGQLFKEPGAVVSGQEVNMFSDKMKLDISELLIIRILLLLMFVLIVFFVGMLYIAASGKKINLIEADIEKDFGKKLLFGFAAYLGATIIMILLFITIIVPVLYFALVVFSTVISSILLGKLIMKAMNSSISIYMEFITGLITITLAELLLTLLIPGEDAITSLLSIGLFVLLINSYGTGALFVSKFSKKQI